MRCHYCNEYGHFIRECSKKNRDENKTGHFNGMSMDYYECHIYCFESKDVPTQMTKAVIYNYILYYIQENYTL